MRIRALYLVLPFAAFLGGCPVWTDDGYYVDPPCTYSGCYCDVDSDCARGLECDGGLCEAPEPECTVDTDCGSAETCEGGMCVPVDTCVVDGDCASGERCADGLCEPTNGCSSDDDCSDGLVCDFRGVCVAPTNGCASDDECDPGDLCIEGECRAPADLWATWVR